MDTQTKSVLFKLRTPVLLCSAALVVCVFGGCQKTLLKKDDPRSPFDRYNQTRAQHAQPFLEDEFGRRTPNLRNRLVQTEE
ncbi:MAG: hypothetical protein AB8C13_07315 [Phycisphaerales bacterium]